jgi:ankyrin repeat protein
MIVAMPTRRAVDERLVMAVLGGDIRTVRQALAAGADPNLVIQAGETVLMYAVSRDTSTQMVRMLLARGARVDRTDDAGRTALHHAALAGRRDVAEVLLARGARMDARASTGETPLDFALRISQDPGLVDLLRAPAGTKGRGQDTGRALAVAAMQGDHRRVWKFVAEGASTIALTEALGAAAQRGDVVLGRGLIDAGASPSGDGAGEPPLHRAAAYGRTDFVQMLIAAGTDPSQQDASGSTALHRAVRASEASPAAAVRTVQALLAADADAGRYDGEGYSPRTRARALGREALISLLPAAPGEPAIDADAADVAGLVLGSSDRLRALWQPNDVVRPFTVRDDDPREPWGADCDAAMALGRWCEEFTRAGAAWAFPIVEAVRDGRWPAYADVVTAYRATHDGRGPQVERFAPWLAGGSRSRPR